jgi:FkbM family methyltransferase
MTREYFRFLQNFLADKKYRAAHLEFRRLSKLPRYTKTTTNLLEKPLEIVDTSSFFGMYKEVFENEVYKFKSTSETPVIIDGGSNIGLSVIYLKSLYPNAKITAFEPDENVFQVLKKNLHSFDITDVELYQAALWTENTDLTFMPEGADSGRVVHVDAGEAKTVKVKAVRLKEFLNQKIDFLKLDIEGAELEVLEDCVEELKNIENLFVEYHSFADLPQKIDRLFNILLSADFRVNAHPCNIGKSPLCERKTYLGMDFQMNIFAYRKG